QIHYRQAHMERRLYNSLPRFIVLHHKAGPQDFMSPYHLLKSPFQPGNIQIAFEPPGYRNVVERIARIEPVQYPRLLLLVGEREKRWSWPGTYRRPYCTLAAS